MGRLSIPADVQGSLLASTGFKNFQPSNTRNLRNALAGVRAGTGRMGLAFLGDSTFAGSGANTGTSGQTGAYPYSVPQQVKNFLAGQLGNQLTTGTALPVIDGAHWGQLNSGGVTYQTYDTRITAIGAGWSWNQRSIGGNMLTNSTDTTSVAFAPTEQFDTIVLYSVQNNGQGTFTVNVDGGAALQTINANAALSVVKTTISGITLNTHTINIQRTGVGGAVFIVGLYVYNSAAPSISVWNWGSAGSASSDWNTSVQPWSPLNMTAQVAPQATLYGLGINDADTLTQAQFITNSTAIINALKTAGGDVILVAPHPVVTTFKTQAGQSAINQAYYILAQTLNLPLIDATVGFESYAQANTNGWMYTDGIHCTKVGYAVRASQIATALSSIGM